MTKFLGKSGQHCRLLHMYGQTTHAQETGYHYHEPIVVHSRDDEEVGVAHEVNHPKTSLNCPRRWDSIG